MGRPSRAGLPMTHREKLRIDLGRAAPLRDVYPQLAEVRVEFQFEDGGPVAPSPRSYAHFPSAQGFFRYACPIHTCSGEFDLSDQVAELARDSGQAARLQNLALSCKGVLTQARLPCPINAKVRVSTIARPQE